MGGGRRRGRGGFRNHEEHVQDVCLGADGVRDYDFGELASASCMNIIVEIRVSLLQRNSQKTGWIGVQETPGTSY